MVEEEMVSGEGWISDDSSFYGDEDEQDRQYSRGNTFKPGHLWSVQKHDLNAILVSDNSRPLTNMYNGTANRAVPPELAKQTERPEGDSTTTNFMSDRQRMEEARPKRMGKRKREPSLEPALFNPGQGCPDAWQLGESADDFVRRLPPRTTSVFTCAWIWAHNPHRDPCDKFTSPRVDEFRSRGRGLLDHSLQTRQQIQTKGLHGPKSILSKTLNVESNALQQRITDLAVECGILSGKNKWMLFPKLEEVTRVWKKVVEGIINNRLGPTAKVAPDEGKPEDRLICIYTKDFRDEDDVLRVLQELETMGLLNPGRSIYYKSDAFTYLDLYKQTATEYGLHASLYTSLKMMAAARLLKATSPKGKKQGTLNKYF